MGSSEKPTLRAWLDAFRQDARYAARQMIGSPVLTLVSAGSMAVGITVAALVFSVFDLLLLRPLPVSDPKAVHHVSMRIGTGS